MTSESQEKSSSLPAAGEQKALPSAAKSDKKPSTRRPTFGAVVGAVLLMLLEIILPAIIGGVAAWFLFYYFRLWQSINHSTGSILFGGVIVAVALLLALLWDSIGRPLRKSVRSKGVKFTTSPMARLMKLLLGGLIVPLLLVAGANLLIIPMRGTAMQMIITAASQPAKLTPQDEVAAIAQNASDPSTRILGIQVLQGYHSTDALTQLIKLIDDRSVYSDAGVTDALMKAIAAYGADAKLPLFNAFRSIDPAAAGASAPSGSDLYTRYFAQSFDSLKGDITSNTPDAATREARLAALQAAQAQLKQNLTAMQLKQPKTGAGDPRLDFILKTLLATDIKEDGDLLAFARTTALDTRYSNVVRGDALLLVGKLGGKDDLDAIYPYLKSSDDLLQARALQAITLLQAKLAAQK